MSRRPCAEFAHQRCSIFAQLTVAKSGFNDWNQACCRSEAVEAALGIGGLCHLGILRLQRLAANRDQPVKKGGDARPPEGEMACLPFCRVLQQTDI